MRRLFSTSSKSKASEKISLSNYPFLKELSLGKQNPGVYHSGKFIKGQGPIIASVNPATG